MGDLGCLSVSTPTDTGAGARKGRRGRSESYAVGGAKKPLRGTGRLFEEFRVVGLPSDARIPFEDPKESAHEGALLFSYPHEGTLATSSSTSSPAALNNQQRIIEFCFPSKIIVKAIPRTQSFTTIHELTLGPLDKLREWSSSFAFLLTDGSELNYAICVLVHDFVNSHPLFDKPQAISNRSRFDFVAPRCYCLLSRFPFFQLHFEFLYSVLGAERLWRLTSEQNQTLIKEELMRLLSVYYNTAVPNDGEVLSLDLPHELTSMQFYCTPSMKEDEMIANWCFAGLFRIVPLNVIISLYNTALLEKPIVIVCPHPGVLASIVLSFIPLLRPFVWQGSIIPVLPLSMQEILQAPVPFIVGVQSLSAELRMDIQAEVTIVDIDLDCAEVQKQVILSQSISLPCLPNSAKLENMLSCQAKCLYSKTSRKMSSQTSHNEFALIRQCHEAVKSFTTWLVYTLIAIPGWNLLRELEENPTALIERVTPSYQEFIGQFVSTQQFHFALPKLQQLLKNKHNILEKLNADMEYHFKFLEEAETKQEKPCVACTSTITSNSCSNKSEESRREEEFIYQNHLESSKQRLSDLQSLKLLISELP
eukprot:TRINITY_DN7554_c0_g1_i1.p1 TRINITY_DN7554_c0_g1~~TRINITY_DN7554_c0_g1_i1.p1  ORF type:complete len:591 (+),score=95.14 TRINITY_DN7554_c0_g1_i1:82-1854(+)